MADIESFLKARLRAALTTAQVKTLQTGLKLPDHKGLVYSMPLVHISCFGGGHDGHILESPAVDIDSYGVSAATARTLSGLVHRHVLVDMPGYYDGQTVVTRVKTITSPRERPYDNESVCRWGASYRFVIKDPL